ncbi:MAG: glucokinase [Myxococcales bacterium]|nr:glucokinase [Myxococcales bacterium]
MILSGDIGGTSTRLAWVSAVEAEDGAIRLQVERRACYASADFPTLLDVCGRFLTENPPSGTVEAAGFGVAGPTDGRSCNVTNLQWSLSASDLEASLGLPRVHLVNDFAAIGLGLAHVRAEDRLVLSARSPEDRPVLSAGGAEPQGPIALIGAGTGLGQGAVLRIGGRVVVLPSEGGHVDFAPRTDGQVALLDHLRRKYGHVSVERVVSGQGLMEIGEFLAMRDQKPQPPSAAFITENAGANPLCAEALDLFLSAYGAAAGNLALTLFATGGVYLAGGIAPRLSHLLAEPEGTFQRAFRDKGRLSSLLAAVPLVLLTSDDVALLGAAEATRSA